MIDLDAGFETEYTLNNGAYFFLIAGAISVADTNLEERDAMGISDVEKVTVKATQDSKLLIIDVPIN